MITQLLRKWFNLPEPVCPSCEILREQLTSSERERRELLNRLIAPPQVEPSPQSVEELKPITPQFTPWRVRQQMLESEDRKAASLMKEKAKEIAELEKELGLNQEAEAK